MSHRITIVCDNCGQEYLLPPEMELPPYWIAIQFTISNKDGEMPADTPDMLTHLCSQECLKEFVAGDIIRSQMALVDKPDPEEDIEDIGENTDDI